MKNIIILLALLCASPAIANCDFKADTATQIFMIGPFVDATDGFTLETALTPGNSDIRISKNGANIVGKDTGGASHDENGMYTATFNAADTDVEGRFQIQVFDAAARPVSHDCNVLGAQEYDRKYGTVNNLNALDVGLIEGPTTVATLATQVSFTITDGPSNDDALNGSVMQAIGGTEKGYAFVSDYTGSTKTVTLKAGVQFTLATTDAVRFYMTPNPIVITADINGTGVTVGAISTGVITADAIAVDAIGESEIATDAITALEIAADTIGSSELAADSITSSELATNAVAEIVDALGISLVQTTIATLASQVDFTLTAGSPDDNAYNGRLVVILDASTSTQKAVGRIRDYVGSTKQVLLQFDPGIFTMATTDTVTILASEF